MLEISVRHAFGGFTLDVRFQRAAGGDGTLRPVGVGQDEHRQRRGRAADAGCRAHRRGRLDASGHAPGHPPQAASPEAGLHLPGSAAVSPHDRPAEPRLRRVVRAPRRPARGYGPRRGTAGHRRASRPAARRPVGRREEPRRHRSRAVVRAAADPRRRAACSPRRGAQGGDPALFRASARRGGRAHPLCQPRALRGRAAGHHCGRPARRRRRLDRAAGRGAGRCRRDGGCGMSPRC